MADGLVHVSDAGGHRASYRDLFCDVLGLQSRTGPIKGRTFRELVAANHVLCATIDGELEAFFKLSLTRALLKRPTIGILIFPTRFFDKERRRDYYLRRRLLEIARRVPLITVLSIKPYDLCPTASLVSRNWIHDPQMWDLWVKGAPTLPRTSLSDRVAELSQGSDIIAVIGKITKKKCVPDLAALLEGSGGRFSAVVAGIVDTDSRESVGRLKALGAMVEDRYLSEDEILSLYGAVKYVWCRYSPGHDAASGVFGRAVQTGVTPIVRDGSYMTTYAKYFGFEVATVNGRDINVYNKTRHNMNAGSVVRGYECLNYFARDAIRKIQAPFSRGSKIDG